MDSAMKCGFCHLGSEADSVCERLWIVNNEKVRCAAHWKCMKYSSTLTQYQFPQFGGFEIAKVEREMTRGKRLKCAECGNAGATAGCAQKSCKKTYHYRCAVKSESNVIVIRAKQHGTILYRVFCSDGHKCLYMTDNKDVVIDVVEKIEGVAVESEKDHTQGITLSDSSNTSSQWRESILSSVAASLFASGSNSASESPCTSEPTDDLVSSVKLQPHMTSHSVHHQVAKHSVNLDGDSASEFVGIRMKRSAADVSDKQQKLKRKRVASSDYRLNNNYIEATGTDDPHNSTLSGKHQQQGMKTSEQPHISGKKSTLQHSATASTDAGDDVIMASNGLPGPIVDDAGICWQSHNDNNIDNHNENDNEVPDRSLSSSAAAASCHVLDGTRLSMTTFNGDTDNRSHLKQGACVVCVPVRNTLSLPHCDNDNLLLFAVKHYQVSYDNVYRWRPSGSRRQILFFLCYVTEKMSAGKDWIFDLLSAYQPSESDVPISDLEQRIKANFTAASHLYTSDVGGMDWVKAFNTDVAFFVLNDITDRDGKARSRLPGGPQIHCCDINTVHFTQTHFKQRQSSTTFRRDHEFQNLCSFLDGVSYGPVYEFPAEQMLCVDSITSVADRLRRHLMMSGKSVSGSIADSKSSNTVHWKSESKSIMVFVRRTSPSLIHHSQLLRRVFNFAQSKLLTTQQHSVCIVTDVGSEVGLSQIPGGLLEPLSRDIKMTVYSGTKPMFSPITCIIISLCYSSM